MFKAVTCKCIILSFFTLGPSICAAEYKTMKLRTLNAVVHAKKSQSHKKMLIEKINTFIGDDIDLNIFDKKKDGISVYAKISRVSRLGVRYRF